MFDNNDFAFDAFDSFKIPEPIKKIKKSKAKRNVILIATGKHRMPFAFCNKLKNLGLAESTIVMIRQFLVMKIFGKRSFRKSAVQQECLSECEQYIHSQIQEKLECGIRKERINIFLSSSITKRLINFFIVQYVQFHKEVAYWLDKTKYPFKIIGNFNQPNQQLVIERIAAGDHIVWINIHHQYQICKNQHLKLLHAPYARSVSVVNTSDYSLCELKFYLWLDEIGGFEAFTYFQEDIREKKRIADQAKRRNVDTKRKVAMLNNKLNNQAFLVHASLPQARKLQKVQS